MIDLRQLFAGLGQGFPFGGPGQQLTPNMNPTALAPTAPVAPPSGTWGPPPVPTGTAPATAPLPPPRPLLAANPASAGTDDPNAMTPAFSPAGPAAAPVQGPPMPPGLQVNANVGTEQQGPPAPAPAPPGMLDKLLGDKDFGADIGNIMKGAGGGAHAVAPPQPHMGVGATGNDAGRASAAQLFQAILASKRPRGASALPPGLV